MRPHRIQRALQQAHLDAQQPPQLRSAQGFVARRRLAIGDPQAPLETFLQILEAHGALGEEGRLAADVQLVSVGDHFDWGEVEDRPRAIADSIAVLSWLASHPPEQVVILLGNHDLSRVCELSFFESDPAFQEARARADALYWRTRAPEKAEVQAFLEAYPFVASVESLARDLAAFSLAQRRLVRHLLESHRVSLAHAASPRLLLVHGAVTVEDLGLLGIDETQARQAEQVASALNGFLRRVVEAWDGDEPLDLQPLHRAQSAVGEGRGILYQRPTHPAQADRAELEGPPRRRFDPRRLPRGLLQATGHIRDNKCRALLGEWVEGPAPEHEGVLRTLRTDGSQVRYTLGVTPPGPDEAGMVFLDGGMNRTQPQHYQLLDLERCTPAERG